MDYNSSTDLQIKHTQIANRCVIGLRRKQSITPAYLLDLCCPTPGTRDCSSLRSMERGLLFVPIARTSTSQVRAFYRWLAPLYLCMGFHLHSDCSLGFFPTYSALA